MSGVREGAAATADRILLSYRPVEPENADDWALAGSDWIRDRMAEPSYLGYRRRIHAGPVAVGDEWEEFVSCGCASPVDVIVRVEAVEGGELLDEETDIDIEPRKEFVAA